MKNPLDSLWGTVIAEKNRARCVAFLDMLSIPMLFFMGAGVHGF